MILIFNYSELNAGISQRKKSTHVDTDVCICMYFMYSYDTIINTKWKHLPYADVWNIYISENIMKIWEKLWKGFCPVWSLSDAAHTLLGDSSPLASQVPSNFESRGFPLLFFWIIFPKMFVLKKKKKLLKDRDSVSLSGEEGTFVYYTI